MSPDVVFTTDSPELLADKPGSEATRVPAGVDGSGTSRLVVDRVEDGRAVLLPLAGGGSDQWTAVVPERLPDGIGERSVVSVTVERGSLRGIGSDIAATEGRAAVAAERLAQLSRPLSDTRRGGHTPVASHTTSSAAAVRPRRRPRRQRRR